MLSHWLTQHSLSWNFVLFSSGWRGRNLQEEHTLLFEISKRYKTKELTRALASELLDDDEFLERRIDREIWNDETALKDINWELIAYDVFLEWVQTNPSGHSLRLLEALRETNPDAAEFFEKPLLCGEKVCCSVSLSEKCFEVHFYQPLFSRTLPFSFLLHLVEVSVPVSLFVNSFISPVSGSALDLYRAAVVVVGMFADFEYVGGTGLFQKYSCLSQKEACSPSLSLGDCRPLSPLTLFRCFPFAFLPPSLFLFLSSIIPLKDCHCTLCYFLPETECSPADQVRIYQPSFFSITTVKQSYLFALLIHRQGVQI